VGKLQNSEKNCIVVAQVLIIAGRISVGTIRRRLEIMRRLFRYHMAQGDPFLVKLRSVKGLGHPSGGQKRGRRGCRVIPARA
jgi:hypothetical protein